MNKDEILNEGYLAAYIVGELPVSEMNEVENFIAQDSEVRKEYLGLQDTVERLAMEYGIKPAEVVKRYIMETESVISRMHQPGAAKGGFNYMMAASVTFAIVSSAFAFYFWNEWRDTTNRLTAMTIEKIELAEGYQRVNLELEGIKQDLAVLVSPEFSRIILSGTDNAADAQTVIYWNATREEVYLNSANLAMLPDGQQYQLWALIDGVPVDAGVFDAAQGEFQVMKNIAKADAFAVTVEKSGGAESPTLSTMQVFGKTL